MTRATRLIHSKSPPSPFISSKFWCEIPNTVAIETQQGNTPYPSFVEQSTISLLRSATKRSLSRRSLAKMDDGHQLVSHFWWNQGVPGMGHDWKISVNGPDNKRHSFNVNLQVVASKSLYFSKYALDEDEKYKETKNKEVVLDWSEMESKAFDKMLMTFKSWLDLQYALIACAPTENQLEIPEHLRAHPFFVKNPLYAACILEYFLCPYESLKEHTKKRLVEMSLSVAVDAASQLQPVFGGDWMDTWMTYYMRCKQFLQGDGEIINTYLMDKAVDAVVEMFSKARSASFTTQRSLLFLYAEFLGHNQEDTTEAFRKLFARMTEWYTYHRGLLPESYIRHTAEWQEQEYEEQEYGDEECKDSALFVLALLALLETEHRLGLAVDAEETEYLGVSFHLTELQNCLTSIMASTQQEYEEQEYGDEECKDSALFVLALLALLETEHRLGLAVDAEETEYLGVSFHLTELQNCLTSIMASTLSPERLRKLHKCDSKLLGKLNEILAKLPTISHAYQMKAALLPNEEEFGNGDLFVADPWSDY